MARYNENYSQFVNDMCEARNTDDLLALATTILDDNGVQVKLTAEEAKAFLIHITVCAVGVGEKSDIVLASIRLLNGFQSLEDVTVRRVKYMQDSGRYEGRKTKRSPEQRSKDFIPKEAQYYGEIEKNLFLLAPDAEKMKILLEAAKSEHMDFRKKPPCAILPEPSYLSEQTSIAGIDIAIPRKIWGDIAGRNEEFTGRTELLEDIETAFKSGKQMQILAGMGGVGKTQTAKQYLYDNIEEYSVICWINAENESSIKQSCNFAIKNPAEDEAISFCNYIAGVSGKWLIVYDNAEIYTSEQIRSIDRYIPKETKNGHILMTTRCQREFHGIRPRLLDVFSEGEAVLYIQRTLGDIEIEDAKRLAKRLSFHPLALSYAVACIRDGVGYRIVDYLADMDKAGIRVLEADDEHPDGYKNTVRTAFRITLDKLLTEPHGETENHCQFRKALEQFINFIPYCPADYIDLDILAEFGVALPDELKSTLKDPVLCGKLVRVLKAHSLCHDAEWSPSHGKKIRNRGRAISVHRLLQEIIAEDLGELGFYGVALFCSTFWYIDGFREAVSGVEDDLPELSKKMNLNDLAQLAKYIDESDNIVCAPNAYEEEIRLILKSRPFSETQRMLQDNQAAIDYFISNMARVTPAIWTNRKKLLVENGVFTEQEIDDFWNEIYGCRKFDLITKVLGYGHLDGCHTYYSEMN